MSPTRRGVIIDRFSALQPLMKRSFASRLPEYCQEHMGNATVHQLEVLHHLQRGAMKMGDLAREVGISETSATAVVDRLVKQELLERRADPADRRIVLIAVTERASAMLADFTRVRRTMLAEAFAVLDDDELTMLVDLLERVATHGTKAEGAA